MTPDEMYKLAAGLGEAKNRQNVEEALEFMHEDIVLESPAWGVTARGKQANREVLASFFADYPDYNVTFDHYLADDEQFIGWGTVRMTMANGARDAGGQTPNGQRVELPVTIRMTFKDGLIASEVFSCDLMQIAIQSGIQPDAMAKAVFAAEETAA